MTKHINYNKIVFFLTTLLLFISCKNPSDCFESTGKIIQKEVSLDFFNTIEVGNEVSLILKQGNTQKVVIETGENLLDNVTVEVIDNKLYMKDESSCNLTRDYAITKVFVTSPNIRAIRSNTARIIKSNSVLNYPNLKLISEDFNQDALNIGDFDLDINTQTLDIIANGNSVFNIKGNTVQLNIGFHSGSSRFNGEVLNANTVHIIQKSTNDILVKPLNNINGDIYSIGDVICYYHPNSVNVAEHYSGKLIFR